MAIIEVQMRTDRFCELVREEINSRPLDRPVYDQPPEIAGKFLERIECTSCVFSDAVDEKVVLNLMMAFDYHDGLANVRDAGSLQPAPFSRKSYPFTARLWMAFEEKPKRKAVLTYELSAFGIPVFTSNFPITLPSDFELVEAAIVADANVVAIRLGTAAGDPIGAPLVDRTEGREWMLHIPGDLAVSEIRKIVDKTMVKAAEDSKKDSQELIIGSLASASWNAAAPKGFVVATGEIVAVDACPVFNVDISIELKLAVSFEFPAPGTQKLFAKLTWDADSTWCDILSTLTFGIPFGIAFHVGVEDEVSDTILGKSLNPGDGFVETGRTDESISFERAGSMPVPSEQFVITHSGARGEGIACGGVIKPKVKAKLVGEVSPPMAGVEVNCNLRAVSLVFHPAKVLLRTDQGYQLLGLYFDRIFFEPAGAWVIDVDTEVMPPSSSTPGHVVLTFRDPPGGRLPAGTATSVYLFSNYGVRWVDLGTIPALSPELLVQLDARKLMHSYCDSISNPWAGGLTEFTWVDPLLDPDYLERQAGLGRLRLWSVGLRDLPETARVELLAIGPEGRERQLGVIEGRRNVALEVLTDAKESLAMRTERAFTAPAPTLTQNWFSPVDIVEMNPDAAEESGPLAGRIAGEMAEQERRGRLPWATTIRLQRQTVAAPHRGRMIVGTVVRGQRVQ